MLVCDLGGGGGPTIEKRREMGGERERARVKLGRGRRIFETFTFTQQQSLVYTINTYININNMNTY